MVVLEVLDLALRRGHDLLIRDRRVGLRCHSQSKSRLLVLFKPLPELVLGLSCLLLTDLYRYLRFLILQEVRLVETCLFQAWHAANHGAKFSLSTLVQLHLSLLQ